MFLLNVVYVLEFNNVIQSKKHGSGRSAFGGEV